MREPQLWRELLGSIIKNPQERRRIAKALDINPVTLERWAQGKVKPRPHYLRQLLNALPQHREELVRLISEEFEYIFEVADEQKEDGLEAIPAAFYVRVLNAHTTTPAVLRTSSISKLILQQALGHLDPNQLGMSITLVRCLTPAPRQQVRSLREEVGRGTAPWPSYLDIQPLLLGAESLAGHAVSSWRLEANQNLQSEQTFLPFLRTKWEMSAAACPLLQANRVAGCLLVSSTQVNYFSPARLELIQNYANLMVLACEPEDFYEHTSVQLALMPAPELQQTHFAHFQRSVKNLMVQSAQYNKWLNRPEATKLVWQQFEEEFIRLAQGLPPTIEA